MSREGTPRYPWLSAIDLEELNRPGRFANQSVAELLATLPVWCRRCYGNPATCGCRPARTRITQRYRKRLRAQGLCVQCKSASPDRVVCERCLARNRAQQHDLRRRRREAGRCELCGSGAHTSADHRRARAAAADEAGRCIGCGSRPRVEGRKRCRECLAADAARAAANRARRRLLAQAA